MEAKREPVFWNDGTSAHLALVCPLCTKRDSGQSAGVGHGICSTGLPGFYITLLSEVMQQSRSLQVFFEPCGTDAVNAWLSIPESCR